MLRSWIARHRSLVATAISGVTIAAVVAGVAIVSSGYEAQKMDLDDGAVWVANAAEQVIGRANPDVLELNTVIESGGADPRVVQSGQTVLLVDEANATLDVVDPALAQLGERVALPPEQPHVLIAGDRAVLQAAGTGEVWILPIEELEGFDAESNPTLALGLDAKVSLADDGTLVAVAPEVGEVYRLDVLRTDTVEQSWKIDATAEDDDLQVTSAGDRWAVLDGTARRLSTESGAIDLSAQLPDDGSAVVQRASAGGDEVLIASSAGLLAVPLDGGATTELVGPTGGTPAAPFLSGGCRYAAWTSGQAWRDCAGDPVDLELEGMPAGGGLEFAANADRVVLNALGDGSTWAVQQGGERIDNWDELIVPDDEQEEVVDQDVPPDVDPEQKPPVAVDDRFGARPGRSTLLPVLLNDYDPNADVLVITEIDGLGEGVGQIDLVAKNQQLQLTLDEAARGQIGFAYTISDGRGGTASASVTVDVRSESENSPPVQVRPTSTTVAVGGRVAAQVIGDWVDPDGDPFYLTSARVGSPDRVSSKPDGEVVFSSGDEDPGEAGVTLTMSDGRDEGTGELEVSVEKRGEVPIVIDPWIALATAGESITIRPLNHSRGGSGPLRLNAVPAKNGVTISPSFESGTFVFSSDRVGTHYLEVTVTDGDQTATGLVRVDVAAPPDAGTRPITVPHTLFLMSPGADTVDPTATDIDPAGGVLVVTGVDAADIGSGVQTEVLDQREVRVSLAAPLDDGPIELRYTISNGLAEAVGTIVVVEIPRPAQRQAPIANDDSATVRVGDVIDIPVLANDEQPDGEPIALEPDLAEPLPDGAGLLFAAGDRLRYLAPEVAGNYDAVYSVTGADGQLAQARVRISVREVDAATNAAPVPPTVTARVLAGERVRVEIPLNGIDPDGDSVALIGVASNPEKGAVVETGAAYVDYEAGQYSSGTDTFTYTVVDTLGARAEGLVRIGISAPMQGARNPVANADAVSVRPDRTVSVQVLANDSDPDGRSLRVAAVEPNSDGLTAEIVDDTIVRITPPVGEGTYSAIYTIENPYGGTSSNFVTVTVDADAPLSYPVVGDTVLTVSDVLDRDSVEVDVFDEVFFADGEVSELGVALVPDFSSSAELLPDKRIRVAIENAGQIIPFSVSHPDDDAIRSYGFIRVPGYDDALPQLDRTAPALKVNSEQTLRIPLNDYVVALGGRTVRLVDPGTVRATHADGAPLVEDETTLVFTSADLYFGSASISFEVTDGTSADDPDGRRAILTLPIEVLARENQPPAFVGAVVDFEPGQSKELDLVQLTNYPYDDIDELAYSLQYLPDGFSAQLNGQRLVVTADLDTPTGAVSSVGLGVRDAINEGSPGVVQVSVVPSTRPLAQPVPDVATTRRGATTVVDVLANDQVNNPFPGTPLSVVAIRGLDGSALPDGVSITPSADRSSLSVTVSSSALPIDTNLQYQLADATLDRSRYVWGNVTISVQDVPDPVTDFRVTEFGDRRLTVAWTPGAANNSPISRYDLTVTDAGTGDDISVTRCTTTVDCDVPTPGNGPDNSVRVAVAAVNQIGVSSAVNNSGGPIWSDVIPPSPTGLSAASLDQGLNVSWKKPPDTSGSPIEKYVVVVAGEARTLTVSPSDPVGTAYSQAIRGIPGVKNGDAVTYSVSARNSAPTSLADWNKASDTGTPAWTPRATGSPTASQLVSSNGTTAKASWDGAFDSNGRAISGYQWAIYPADADTPACVTPADGGSWSASTGATFDGLSPNTSYRVVVYARNGLGDCDNPSRGAAISSTLIPRATPGTVTDFEATGPERNGDGSRWDFVFESASWGSGTTDSVRYRIISGDSTVYTSGDPIDDGDFLDGADLYGTELRVQVKACQEWPEITLCSSDWSSSFDLGTAVEIVEPAGLSGTGTRGLLGLNHDVTWTWSEAPAGGYDRYEYSCGGDWTAFTPGVGSCTHTGFGAAPDLTLRITQDGSSDPFERDIEWKESWYQD